MTTPSRRISRWVRAISASRSAGTPRPSARGPLAEPLEGRLLMAAAPYIRSSFADNRGTVTLNLSRPVVKSTVKGSSISVYTFGKDRKFNTADDVLVPATISYSGKKTITVASKAKLDQSYRVIVRGSNIKASDGKKLDAEFNGSTVRSGNGSSGGNYNFVARKTAGNRVARYTTIAGFIDVELFVSTKPISTANFVNYANKASWDGTFIHRSIPGFVVQGGGFRVTKNGTVGDVASDPAITNEPGVSNTRGTIAFARAVDGNETTTADQNSATNQWFFNLTDDNATAGAKLDSQEGGFAVFGRVTDANGLAAMDALAKYERVDATGGSSSSPFSDLPVRSKAVLDARGKYDIPNDVILISRVAILDAQTAT